MMTTANARPEPESYSTTVSRVFAAPRDFVFDAFTKPELLRKWWGPEGFTLSDVEIDLRVGGTVRFEKSGNGMVVTVVGRITSFEPGATLGYTWAWLGDDGKPQDETYVAISFSDHADGTEVVLTHTGFADQHAADQHNRGWSSTFNCFDQTQ
jgi:uncharacterized protein YndB with AHSA1/START domain